MELIKCDECGDSFVPELISKESSGQTCIGCDYNYLVESGVYICKVKYIGEMKLKITIDTHDSNNLVRVEVLEDPFNELHKLINLEKLKELI